MNKCEARQQSDQKRCERCDLLWDMNDPDPPQCRTAHDIEINKIRRGLSNDKANLANGSASTPHRH